MTLEIAGHEFEPKVDQEAEVRYREISDILDEVGRDSDLAGRIREECRAEGRDPEEAILTHPDDCARLDERYFRLKEQHAKAREEQKKRLRDGYGWTAWEVSQLSDEEVIEAFQAELRLEETD